MMKYNKDGKLRKRCICLKKKKRNRKKNLQKENASIVIFV